MRLLTRTIQTVALASMLVAAGWMASRDARAVALPVEVELTIQPAFGLYGTPGPTVFGNGIAIVNGSGAGGHLSSLALPASLVATAGLTMPTTDPAVAPVMGLQLTVANAAGSVAATGGGHIAGVVALPGTFRFCLFAPCGGAIANLDVPLTPIGAGGSATVPGPVNVSVFGAPWTSGTAMVGAFGFNQTLTGFAHGPASGTSSTAQPGGTLQLVTPISITTNLGADNLIFAFGILTLRFVPEPGTALLVGAGALLLGAIGRRS
jgi:hypothetical protein